MEVMEAQLSPPSSPPIAMINGDPPLTNVRTDHSMKPENGQESANGKRKRSPENTESSPTREDTDSPKSPKAGLELSTKKAKVDKEATGEDGEDVLAWLDTEISATGPTSSPTPKSKPKRSSSSRSHKSTSTDSDDALTNLMSNVILPIHELMHTIKDYLPGLPADIRPLVEKLLPKKDWDKLVGKLSKNITLPASRSPTHTSSAVAQRTGRRKKGDIVKPRTAFHFWAAEQRPKLTHLQFSEVPTELGRLWKEVTLEEKGHYQDMADKDKERYYSEAGPDAGMRAPPTPRRSRPSTSHHETVDDGPIMIRSKRTSPEVMRKLKELENTVIVDVSSKSPDARWGKFCLSFPHGDIPVPFTDNELAMSVEGIFEGLKVFEKAGVDRSTFSNRTMKVQRHERLLGKLLGWARGFDTLNLLNPKHARFEILLPSFKVVLDTKLTEELEALREIIKSGKRIVLLDNVISPSLIDYDKPLSIAHLIKRYLQDKWPSIDEATKAEAELPPVLPPARDTEKAIDSKRRSRHEEEDEADEDRERERRRRRKRKREKRDKRDRERERRDKRERRRRKERKRRRKEKEKERERAKLKRNNKDKDKEQVLDVDAEPVKRIAESDSSDSSDSSLSSSTESSGVSTSSSSSPRSRKRRRSRAASSSVSDSRSSSDETQSD